MRPRGGVRRQWRHRAAEIITEETQSKNWIIEYKLNIIESCLTNWIQMDPSGSKWIQMELSLRAKQLHRCRSIIRFYTKALPAASWFCMSPQYTDTHTHTEFAVIICTLCLPKLLNTHRFGEIALQCLRMSEVVERSGLIKLPANGDMVLQSM